VIILNILSKQFYFLIHYTNSSSFIIDVSMQEIARFSNGIHISALFVAMVFIIVRTLEFLVKSIITEAFDVFS